jgi:RNA polymerase sigma-70 factor (ECF subfamily)
MARPVFGRSSAAEEARSRVASLDRDRELVEAARRDPALFEPLYRKYVAQVYSFAFYELRDQHAAEDVTARTFVSALAALPGFREGWAGDPGTPPRGDDVGGHAGSNVSGDASTFRVWLFRIARNAVANQRRSARRRPVAPLEDAALLPDPLDLEAGVTAQDGARAAWAAIARLPEDRRQALLLRFVDEMTTAEIAAILGRSEGAVRVLLHRGLRAVERDLRALEPDARRDPVSRRREAR